MIRVFHNPQFLKCQSDVHFSPRLGFQWVPTPDTAHLLSNLTWVATVKTESLDMAFAETQHMDHHDWRANVVVVRHSQGTVRSTSAGDVLVDETGQPWYISFAGFMRLTLPKPLDEPNHVGRYHKNA